MVFHLNIDDAHLPSGTSPLARRAVALATYCRNQGMEAQLHAAIDAVSGKSRPVARRATAGARRMHRDAIRTARALTVAGP